VKVVLMLRVDEAAVAAMSADERDAMYAEYGRWVSELAGRGLLIDGAELLPTPAASTVRAHSGEPVASAGPADPRAEQVAGYFLIECDSVEAAIAAAGLLPAARHGSVEVRPLVER
jgi:hypothetical protein